MAHHCSGPETRCKAQAGSIEPMNVFVTGGTGYIGTRLIAALVRRGDSIRAVVRRGSEKKLPAGVRAVVADPLQLDSYTADISPGDTVVHLIGVPHPSPAKAKQFREMTGFDSGCGQGGRRCRRPPLCLSERCPPAPVMKAFIAVRQRAKIARATGIPSTSVRPWYVLGPGHWWPYPLCHFSGSPNACPEPGIRPGVSGLVTVRQLVAALVWAVENGSDGFQIIDVPTIRTLSLKF